MARPVHSIVASSLLLLLIARDGSARDDPPADTAHAAGDRRDAPRLRLGPYANPYAGATETPSAVPRFESHVEVHGRIPPDLEESRAIWTEHFNLQTSIYGRGIAIQKSGPPGSVNVLPLVEWLVKKAKESKRAPKDRAPR